MQWNAPLDDHQILGVMSDEGRGLLRGCYWGEYTRHGVLDIDPGSQYHNPEALTKLLQEFSVQGLRLVPYQSSERGGWHLYLFFDRDVLSKEVETTIKEYLRLRKYEIRGGTLEVFPSGNALRLPLQPGFAWLSSDGKIEVKREELTQEQALALFFNDIYENRNNWAEAKEWIESQIRSAGAAGDVSAQEHRKAVAMDGLEGLFQKGIDWEKWQRGRSYWHLGLTDKSQRHDAIICVGHYLWYGDEAAGLAPLPFARNKTERAELIKRWLEEKNGGQSEDINRGRWGEVSADIERATAWTKQAPVAPEYEPYRLTDRLLKRLQWLHTKTAKLWTVEELAKANIDRSQNARQRIAVAVAQLEAEGQIATKAAVARRAKASRNTVVKNLDLLTLCSSEYIAGGLGVVLPSLLPAACSGSENSFQISLVQEISGFVSESSRGRIVLGQQGVETTGLVSSDQSQSFQVLSRESVPVSFSFQSEMPDTEPGNFIGHRDTVLPACEMGVTAFDDSLNFPVAPLFHGWRESQPESPQSKDRALRVAAQVLTLGPRLSGIQPLRHVTTGGFDLCLEPGSVWYADATKYGTEERAGATSREGAQSSFEAATREINTVLDATNYKLLTTGKSGYSSGIKDKISLIDPTPNVINFPVSVPQRSFEAVALMTAQPIKQCVDSLLITLSLLPANAKAVIGHLKLTCRQLFCDHLGDCSLYQGRGPPTCKQTASGYSCDSYRSMWCLVFKVCGVIKPRGMGCMRNERHSS